MKYSMQYNAVRKVANVATTASDGDIKGLLLWKMTLVVSERVGVTQASLGCS
jgi:hypothetical protein